MHGPRPRGGRGLEPARGGATWAALPCLYYPKGKKRDVSVYFRPLLYMSSVGKPPRCPDLEEIKMADEPAGKYTMSGAKRKYIFTSPAAARLAERGSVLVVSRTMPGAWQTAGELVDIMETGQEDASSFFDVDVHVDGAAIVLHCVVF